MIRSLFIWLLLKLCPAMLALKCDECGRVVDPANVESHNSYFHPGRVMNPEDCERTEMVKAAHARLRVKTGE